MPGLQELLNNDPGGALSQVVEWYIDNPAPAGVNWWGYISSTIEDVTNHGQLTGGPSSVGSIEQLLRGVVPNAPAAAPAAPAPAVQQPGQPGQNPIPIIVMGIGLLKLLRVI